MLADELKKLLDILRTCLVQSCVVDKHNDLFEVVVFLLPLEVGLGQLILAEVLKEDEHSQVLEVTLLLTRKKDQFKVETKNRS